LALHEAFDEHSHFDPQLALSPTHDLQVELLHSFFGAVEQPTRSPDKAAAARTAFFEIFISATVRQHMRVVK